ncbi:MAG: hypothetical protein ACKPEY_07570 [Planctomycetota bacterium]
MPPGAAGRRLDLPPFITGLDGVMMAVTVMVVMRRRTGTSLAMDLAAAGAVASRALPQMGCTATRHLRDVQCQNGEGENLSAETHDALQTAVTSGRRPVLIAYL